MRNRRILLIEDNPDDQELALSVLDRVELGAQVEVAADGVEGLDRLLATGASRPALVLLDLKLPRLDGFDVLRRIRSEARTAYTPVVVFTSSGERSDLQKCYELGCNSYVQKPVDATAFAATVRDIAMYWLGRNEGLVD